MEVKVTKEFNLFAIFSHITLCFYMQIETAKILSPEGSVKQTNTRSMQWENKSYQKDKLFQHKA